MNNEFHSALLISLKHLGNLPNFRIKLHLYEIPSNCIRNSEMSYEKYLVFSTFAVA